MKKTYIIPAAADLSFVCEQLMQDDSLGVHAGSGQRFDEESMIE